MSILRDAGAIWDALALIAARAEAAGIDATIVVMGGAAIELRIGDRGATRDIDALVFRHGALDAVITDVAEEQGWPKDWLNDAVQLYVSDYVNPHDWPVERAYKTVTVKVAPLEVLCAMKLRAARGRRDFDDLDVVLDALGWDRERAEAGFDALYPHDALSERALAYLDARYPS